MEFTGGGTAILVALAAGLWLVYLVPMRRPRSEYLSTERNALRPQQTLRIMAQTAELPEAVRPYLDRCVALTSTPARLSQVRSERRPDSRYASLQQCTWELKRADELYRAHRLPVINSAGMSVEEMAAVIMHTRQLKGSG